MIKKCKFNKISYYIYSKEKIETTKKYSVIIHVHGSGSRGTDLDVAINGNPIIKYAEKQKDFPFIVVSPQCYADTWFDIYEQLKDFIEFVKSEPYVEENNLFLSGISMGGYCSWQLLMSMPETFTKAVICCGGGMYWNAERIKTPVKAFHGKLDDSVYCEETEKMEKRARKGVIDATYFDDLGHNVWDRVYNDKKTYEWLKG